MQCAAGIAACALYADGEPQRRAGEVAASFRAKGNKVLQDLGVNARLYGRSIVHLYLGEIECEAENDSLPPVSDYSKIFSQEPHVREDRTRLSLHLHQQGIATALGRMLIFSQAHDEDDVEQTVRALRTSVETMQQEGSWTIG
jgi:glutamate-1-semialdehyde aminotransferase